MSKPEPETDPLSPAPVPAEDDVPQPDDTPQETGDWRDAIGDRKMRAFAERIASPADAAKMAYELRRKLSRALVPPGADADEKEIRAFRRKLGVPDSVENYGYERPEMPEYLRPGRDGEARETAFLERALELGITREQAHGILDWHYRDAVDANDRLARTLIDGRAKAEAELRREWGADYAANLAAAHRAAAEFGGHDMLDFLAGVSVDGVRLADHPRLVRAFAEAGRRLGEDSIALPGADGGGATLEERVKDLRNRKQDALARGDRDAAQRLDAEERGLWERIAEAG